MPRLAYLVTEDWYFMMHRLPMARAAKAAGYEVHVATRVDRHGPAIEAEGFILHPVPWRRGSFDPLAMLRAVMALRALLRRIKPDVTHHVAVMPAVLGSIAALGLPVARLNALVGLGFVSSSQSLKARLVRPLLGVVLPRLLDRPKSMVLVENPDDRDALVALGVARDRITVVLGSGVDVERLTPTPEPAPPVTVAFAGRMIEEKGVRTLVEAHRLLTARGLAIRLLLAGTPDAGNPRSLSREEIEAFARAPNVTWLGHVDDIRGVWAQAHVAALASRGGEGVPMSLLEAAACGRPLVATDVSGCREIVRPGTNGFLVPKDDASALADAIAQLAADQALRRRYGAASREIAEADFSSRRVGRDVVGLYDRLIGRSPTLPT